MTRLFNKFTVQCEIFVEHSESRIVMQSERITESAFNFAAFNCEF